MPQPSMAAVHIVGWVTSASLACVELAVPQQRQGDGGRDLDLVDLVERLQGELTGAATSHQPAPWA